jgi:hypothetical protein
MEAGDEHSRYVPLKHRLAFNGLHGFISQRVVLFITTSVKTSHPTMHVVLITNLFTTFIDFYPGSQVLELASRSVENVLRFDEDYDKYYY